MDADLVWHDGQDGIFTISRTGDASAPVSVHVSLQGSTATPYDGTPPPCNYSQDFFYWDFDWAGDPNDTVVMMAETQSSVTVTIRPLADWLCAEGSETVVMTILPNAAYAVASAPQNSATLVIEDRPSAHSYPDYTPNAPRTVSEGGSTTFRLLRDPVCNSYLGLPQKSRFYLLDPPSYSSDTTSGDYTLIGLPSGTSVSFVRTRGGNFWYVETTIPANVPWLDITIQTRADNIVEGSEVLQISELACPNTGIAITILDQGDPTYSYIAIPSDGTITPVAAVGIDQNGLAAGMALRPTGFQSPAYYEAPFWYNGEDTIRLHTSDNPNCSCTYLPGNPDYYTGRANGILGSTIVGYIGYDASDVPTAATWINEMPSALDCAGVCSGAAFYSEIRGINSSASLCGYTGSFTVRNARRGSLSGWSVQLPGFSGSTFAYANAINVNNETVGASKNPAENNALKGCYWDANGVRFTLQPLSGYTQSEALAINDSGLIVGYSMNSSDSSKRACLWSKVGSDYQATYLGVLVAGYYSVATAVNNSGRIVGYSAGHACKWLSADATGIRDLNSRVANTGGKVLARAYAINGQGKIAGATAWQTQDDPSQIYPVNDTANAYILSEQ